MTNNIKLDYSRIYKFLQEEEIDKYSKDVMEAHEKLLKGTGKGSDYIGWVDLPNKISKEALDKIETSAKRIQQSSECLLVIGIGGSYLGARAIIEFLNNNFYTSSKNIFPHIFFGGNNMNPEYINDLIELISEKDFSINVISKSGNTLEVLASFAIFKKLLEEKYGKEEARNRIIVTTENKNGNLKNIADSEGYDTFYIPDNVGGRYSFFTAASLLPIATSGINIGELIEGGKDGYKEYNNNNINENICYKYATIRNALYQKNKNIEIFSNFDPSFKFFSEWLKQLFAESEGKDNKGIFPASLNFSTDLHSLGQYVQEGKRNLFETFIFFEKSRKDIVINDVSGANSISFLKGKSFSQINEIVFESTIKAHHDGGVPTMAIRVPEKREYYLGKLVYFFEKACGISGYLLEVNPFNQPGVEVYKKNMYTLLGKHTTLLKKP